MRTYCRLKLLVEKYGNFWVVLQPILDVIKVLKIFMATNERTCFYKSIIHSPIFPYLPDYVY